MIHARKDGSLAVGADSCLGAFYGAESLSDQWFHRSSCRAVIERRDSADGGFKNVTVVFD